MTYYLGKVGRAGAHILSSCKDLYNDVNAAYLTGAVDIIVIRQKDGSLKSTPFHVRFGKLGVLRTGDLKEVEVEINGKPVDLHMKIDETGRGFFSMRKQSETASESDSEKSHVALDIELPLPQSLSAPYLKSQSYDSHMTQATPLEQTASVSSSSSTIEEVPLTHLPKQNSDSMLLRSQTTHPEYGYGSRKPGSLTAENDSGLEVPIATSDSLDSSVFRTEDTTEQPLCFSVQRKSTPIDIETCQRYSSEDMSPRVCSSLPMDVEVMSDSALERDRSDSIRADSGHTAPSALSDTEVEVKDRLSSKLWEWSASGRRKRQTSLGEPSSNMYTGLPEEESRGRLKPQPAAAAVDHTGFWSALTGILKRKSNQRFSSMEDGIYLDDIDYDSMDPDELSKFFPSSFMPCDVPGVADQTGSSGLGSSPTLSPSQSSYGIQKEETSKLVSTLDNCAFSLCGGLAQGTVTDEQFQNAQVSYSEFSADPASIISHPNLVVRVSGKYYNWQTASALVMSSVAYLQVIPDSAQESLTKKYMPKKSQKSFWYFWGRGSKDIDDDSDMRSKAKSEGNTPIGSPRKWEPGDEGRERLLSGDGVRGRSDSVRERSDSVRSGTGDSVRGRSDSVRERSDSVRSGTGDGVRKRSDSVRSGDILSSDDEQEIMMPIRPRQRSLKKKKTGFTTSLTSEQLSSLRLMPGANTVVFSITTKYQGTTKAQCTLYLWNYFDKIVVSDIDGTITRSDVAGQVLPLLGKDWTQNGVVELFSSVSRNGYRIMYLSARAIGQAGYTKEFLRNVKRGSSSLPDGPLFLAPFSLYKAFKKEVIEKKPEEFKIECLKQIREQFPDNFNPFHAGFGNKSSDVKSYVEVDIPQSRIFTVNHKGHLKHELSISFQSNYMDLMEFVDAQFPPVKYVDSSLDETDSISDLDEADIEAENIKEDYNMFNYWKDPTNLSLYFDLPELT